MITFPFIWVTVDRIAIFPSRKFHKTQWVFYFYYNLVDQLLNTYYILNKFQIEELNKVFKNKYREFLNTPHIFATCSLHYVNTDDLGNPININERIYLFPQVKRKLPDGLKFKKIIISYSVVFAFLIFIFLNIIFLIFAESCNIHTNFILWFGILLSVCLHEIGHLVAVYIFKYKLDYIFIDSMFSGSITFFAPENLNPKHSIIISVAGPLVNFILGITMSYMGTKFDDELSSSFYFLGFLNFLIFSLQLFLGSKESDGYYIVQAWRKIKS